MTRPLLPPVPEHLEFTALPVKVIRAFAAGLKAGEPATRLFTGDLRISTHGEELFAYDHPLVRQSRVNQAFTLHEPPPFWSRPKQLRALHWRSLAEDALVAQGYQHL